MSGSNFPITQAGRNENNLLNNISVDALLLYLGMFSSRSYSLHYIDDNDIIEIKALFISGVQEMNILAYGLACCSETCGACMRTESEMC